MSLTSCHPSGKEVAGKYYARHGKGTDCIELQEDGTFKQYFKNDTTENTNEGTWKFETELKQEKLLFRDYVTYALPDDVELSGIGKKGSASIYWEKDKIIFYTGAEEKYNYYRQSD